jgi:hypothetical protein
MPPPKAHHQQQVGLASCLVIRASSVACWTKHAACVVQGPGLYCAGTLQACPGACSQTWVLRRCSATALCCAHPTPRLRLCASAQVPGRCGRPGVPRSQRVRPGTWVQCLNAHCTAAPASAVRGITCIQCCGCLSVRRRQADAVTLESPGARERILGFGPETWARIARLHLPQRCAQGAHRQPAACQACVPSQLPCNFYSFCVASCTCAPVCCVHVKRLRETQQLTRLKCMTLRLQSVPYASMSGSDGRVQTLECCADSWCGHPSAAGRGCCRLTHAMPDLYGTSWQHAHAQRHHGCQHPLCLPH